MGRPKKKSDDPDEATEAAWCNERRKEVLAYLRSEGLRHGRVGVWPAWHVWPYVSLWAIESRVARDRIGWWAVSGDLPTDYVSADGVVHPREALRAIASLWREAAGCMKRGEPHPQLPIGERGDWRKLAPLLLSRAQLFESFANDDSLWEE
ncbi:MAG: DUF4826 family protein [Planctomycetota bacterium]